MGATRLSNLKPGEISIVKRGANEQEFLIVKEDDKVADPTPVEKVLKEAGLDAAIVTKVATALVPVIKTATDAAASEAKTAAEKEFQMKLEDAKKKKPEDGEPVQKEDGSYDYTNVPAAMVPVWKAKHASDARAAKIEKQLAEERDARITKEFNERAAGFKHLGVKTEDLGAMLKEMSEKAPEAFKKLEPILKGLDEKIAKGGLFNEIGTTQPGGSVTRAAGQTEAEAKIDVIAKGYVEKDAKMTRVQAVAKAWNDNPQLYNEHRAEIERRKRA